MLKAASTSNATFKSVRTKVSIVGPTFPNIIYPPLEARRLMLFHKCNTRNRFLFN